MPPKSKPVQSAREMPPKSTKTTRSKSKSISDLVAEAESRFEEKMKVKVESEKQKQTAMAKREKEKVLQQTTTLRNSPRRKRKSTDDDIEEVQQTTKHVPANHLTNTVMKRKSTQRDDPSLKEGGDKEMPATDQPTTEAAKPNDSQPKHTLPLKPWGKKLRRRQGEKDMPAAATVGDKDNPIAVNVGPKEKAQSSSKGPPAPPITVDQATDEPDDNVVLLEDGLLEEDVHEENEHVDGERDADRQVEEDEMPDATHPEEADQVLPSIRCKSAKRVAGIYIYHRFIYLVGFMQLLA